MSPLKTLVLTTAAGGSLVLPAVAGANIAFSINFADAPGEGFFDPTLGQQRRDALAFSTDIWSGLLAESFPGETITLNAQFNPQGGTANSATLASAGPGGFVANFGSIDPQYRTNTFYGDPLANHLARRTLDGDTDIFAVFNSDVDGPTVFGSAGYYYGTDQMPGRDVDFVTVALHEIGHGLNFTDLYDFATGTYPTFGTTEIPGIFDRLLETGAGDSLVSLTPAQRMAAVAREDLFWSGPAATAANGGERVRMYDPFGFEPGSSISHVDEATFPDDLLSPLYSGVDHTPSDIDLGILTDMGWDVVVIPEPGTLAILLAGGGLLLARGRRVA